MYRKRTNSGFILSSLLAAMIIFTGCSNNAGSGSNASPGASASASPSAEASGTQSASPSAAAPSGPDISKKVELSMYLPSDGAPDAKLIHEELNKMTERDINATVKITFLSNDAYNLMLSSGEKFDLIFAANYMNYADNARRGAFKEITPEMLSTYAPQSAKEDKDKLAGGYVGGKMFAIPTLAASFNYSAYVVRGDLMKKYNVPDIKTIDDFGVYLDAVAKNEKSMIPYNMGKNDAWTLCALYFGNNNLMAPGAPNCTSPIALKKDDPSLQLLYTFDLPETTAFIKKMKQWKDAGYWSKNALSNTVSLNDSFKNGKNAALITSIPGANNIYNEVNKSHPEWDLRIYPAFQGSIDRYSYMAGGMAIGAKSENAERALMLLDLLRYNEDYNMLTQYGFEGTHYTINDKGDIVFPADSKYPPNAAGTWGWTNETYTKVFDGSFPNYAELLADAKSRYVPNPLVDFTIDAKEISDVTTNLSNLFTQYAGPLYMGFTNDVDAGIQEYKDQLKKAGVERYKEAAQAQIDAYMKSK
ncbi:ABC transporter substrate-binding protein [Cohnella hashimotonis]|uniref:ABC transporter substrate-binding protein n=1 Tax=Cohnella hashimotonis TaxID=2826895 RepID=A0ABT6TV56_9BACL|nr:ABC transporter substrate-binding protein [Cohnella hashimotonis]MDI4649824.1 ABC transporter substrate-binding protein [Cohnella hashimotonis]